MVARRSAAAEPTQTINQARARIVTGPDDLRTRFTGHTAAGLVADLASLRPRPGSTVGYATRIALRELGRRAEFFDAQLGRLDELIVPLVTAYAPGLLALYGIGPQTAALLLIAAGDHPGRLRSEACTAPNHRDRSDLRVHGSHSGGTAVLVDDAPEYFPALHRRVQRYDDRFVMIGWPLLPGLMRPMSVIVPGVGPKHCPQMGFAVDQHPVRALSPYRPYPAFGITVRPGRPRRNPHDPHALAGEDSIEHAGELGVAVPDEEPEQSRSGRRGP